MGKPDKRPENAGQQSATPTYTKQQFLESKRFRLQEKDLLNALLEENKTYTTDEVLKILSDFLKKEAK